MIGALALLVVLAVDAVTGGRAAGSRPVEAVTLFGAAAPSLASASDDRAVQVGITFSSSAPGWISAVRFYRGPMNAGPHDVSLWGPGGEELGHGRLASSGPEGWQEVPLDRDVPVQDHLDYTASYRAPQGHYSTGSPPPSVTAPTRDQVLTARGGVYTYGSGMPRDTFENTYYFVDVVFTTSTPPPGPSGPPGTPSAGSAGSSATPAARTGATPGARALSAGVPSGTVLAQYTGPTTITRPGTVIDAMDVRGALVVQAKDVVIRRSKIHGAPEASAGVLVTDAGSVTITDSEIYDVQVGIANGSWSALRVDIHDTTSDGVKIGSDVLLQDSWIHAGRPGPDAHWDGAQVQSGITRSVLRGNRIDASGPGTNAALFVAPDLGPTSSGPLVVEDNHLDGGNYTVYVLDGANGRFVLSGIVVRDNRFGRTAQYGPTDITVPVDWTGNVWDDTGEPVVA